MLSASSATGIVAPPSTGKTRAEERLKHKREAIARKHLNTPELSATRQALRSEGFTRVKEENYTLKHRRALNKPHPQSKGGAGNRHTKRARIAMLPRAVRMGNMPEPEAAIANIDLDNLGTSSGSNE